MRMCQREQAVYLELLCYNLVTGIGHSYVNSWPINLYSSQYNGTQYLFTLMKQLDFTVLKAPGSLPICLMITQPWAANSIKDFTDNMLSIHPAVLLNYHRHKRTQTEAWNNHANELSQPVNQSNRKNPSTHSKHIHYASSKHSFCSGTRSSQQRSWYWRRWIGCCLQIPRSYWDAIVSKQRCTNYTFSENWRWHCEASIPCGTHILFCVSCHGHILNQLFRFL